MAEESGTVMAEDAETVVRKSVVVDVDREHAFRVFTDGFDSWWFPSHSIGEADLAEAVIEPRTGGRWYERGVDGSECDWGYVIAWDPPGRVVLAWQINGQWKFDPDLVTEVDVTFTEESPSCTRVELEHRHLDRMGEAGSQMRATFESDGGWPGLLAAFAARATAG